MPIHRPPDTCLRSSRATPSTNVKSSMVVTSTTPEGGALGLLQASLDIEGGTREPGSALGKLGAGLGSATTWRVVFKAPEPLTRTIKSARSADDGRIPIPTIGVVVAKRGLLMTHISLRAAVSAV